MDEVVVRAKCGCVIKIQRQQDGKELFYIAGQGVGLTRIADLGNPSMAHLVLQRNCPHLNADRTGWKEPRKEGDNYVWLLVLIVLILCWCAFWPLIGQ